MEDAGPKPFTASAPVYGIIEHMVAAEQRAIKEAISTPAKAWALYRASGRIGTPLPGEDIRAVCIKGMWLVFFEKADRRPVEGGDSTPSGKARAR